MFKFCPCCGAPVELEKIGHGLIGSRFKCTNTVCGKYWEQESRGCFGVHGKLTIKEA